MRTFIFCTPPQILLGESSLGDLRWEGHMARMGQDRNVYKVLMGNPEGKRPLGRSRRRWEDGIRMDIREIGWGSVDPVGSGYGPMADSCEYGNEPLGSGATELVSSFLPPFV
jgi:hypothetical protein